MSIRIYILALLAAVSLPVHAVAPAAPPAVGDGNPVVCGNKRITIITPTLIRLEYATDGRFVDAPTMFASNRDSVMRAGYTVRTLDDGRRVEINTGAVRMVFANDNLPFGQGNTEFHFTRWGRPAQATARNLHSKTRNLNLGGSIATLDGVAGEVPLDDGLLSYDGWYHLIDTGTELITPDGWFEPRPATHVQDQYCFLYGDDFHAPFADLGVIAGRVPMTRRYMHGVWYSRWYPYDDTYIRELIDGYRDHGFPLDVLSMDMDWHTITDATVGTGHNNTALGWTGHSWNRRLISDPAATIAALHADSIYVCVNEHPHDGIRPHEDCYAAFMTAMGEDPASGRTLVFDASDRRYMDNYIRESRRENHALGVDFWWLDWQQDYLYPYVRGSHLRHVPWLNRLYYADTETRRQARRRLQPLGRVGQPPLSHQLLGRRPMQLGCARLRGQADPDLGQRRLLLLGPRHRRICRRDTSRDAGPLEPVRRRLGRPAHTCPPRPQGRPAPVDMGRPGHRVDEKFLCLPLRDDALHLLGRAQDPRHDAAIQPLHVCRLSHRLPGI